MATKQQTLKQAKKYSWKCSCGNQGYAWVPESRARRAARQHEQHDWNDCETEIVEAAVL